MKIDKLLSGDSLTLYFDGEFGKDDIAGAEAYLKKNIKYNCSITKKVIFDLAKVKTLSWQGLTLLLAVKRKLTQGAKIYIVNACSAVYDYLESEGITELIDVKKA